MVENTRFIDYIIYIAYIYEIYIRIDYKEMFKMTELQERFLELWSKGKLGEDEYQMISLRLPVELLADLDHVKNVFDTDRTALIRTILQQGIKEILDLEPFMKESKN